MTHAAMDNSALFATRPDSTYKSGKAVQTTGATSPQVVTLGDGQPSLCQRAQHLTVAAFNSFGQETTDVFDPDSASLIK
jgi:hypothetical protein